MVDELTTENNLVTTDGDGHYTLTATLLPARQQVDGEWKDIDTTLEVRADGRIAPVLTADPVSFTGGGADTAIIEQSAGDTTYTVGWDTELPAPDLDRNIATYRDVSPGIDLQLTATPIGFTQVLIVQSAEAAADPLLDDLTFTSSVDNGELQVDEDGSFEVTDAAGETVLQGPAPSMWDSTLDAKVGPIPSAEVVGSGEQTDLPVDVANGTSTDMAITIDPPEQALTSTDTTYPVFIDPPASGVRQAYLELLSNGASYFNDPNWNPKVGLCEWAGCNNIGVGRALMQYDLSAAIKGIGTAKVANARLYVQQIHNATGCTAQPVNLLASGAFNATTNWPGPVGAVLDTRSSAAGDSCGGPGNVTFASAALDQYVAAAVNQNRPDIAFGLKAPNEGDRNQWKQFSNAISNSSANVNVLEFDFNYPPALPSGITVSHANTCAGIPVTEDQRPTITYSAKDGNVPVGPFRIRTQLYPGNGSNGHLASGAALGSGERVTTTVANAVYLVMQTDGNLVLYSRGTALWSSRTSVYGSYAVMQTDGNLVVRAPNGAAQWASGTAGNPGAGLSVQSDGNLVIYDGPAIWYTATHAPLPTIWSGGDPIVQSEVPYDYTQTRGDLGTNVWRIRLTGWTAANSAVEWWGPTRDVQFETVKTLDTAPTVTSNNIARNNWSPKGGTFTVTSTDPNLVAFAYTWTGTAPGPIRADECDYVGTGLIKAVNGSAQISTAGLPDGPHNLVVTAVNRAHGMSEPTSPYTFYLGEGSSLATSLFEAESASTFDPDRNTAVTSTNLPCNVCSGTGNNVRRLGTSAPQAGDSYVLSFPTAAEADYAFGAWVRTGPNRPEFTVAINDVVNPANEVDGEERPQVYKPSTTAEGLAFIPLGGAHLSKTTGTQRHTITLTMAAPPNGTIPLELDSITAVNYANTTLASFAEALNNDGIGADNTRPDFAPNGKGYGLSASQLQTKYGYAAGQTITLNGMAFPIPAARADGLDNVIAAGQIIQLPPTDATEVNMLVASTCQQTPTGANITARLKFATGGPADRRIPPVPDWVSGQTTSANAQSVQLRIVEPAMGYYLVDGTTRSANVKLYTVSMKFSNTDGEHLKRKIVSIQLPNYGTTFTCANPALHVLSIGTMNRI